MRSYSMPLRRNRLFDRRARVRAGNHVEHGSHRFIGSEHNAFAMLLAVDVGNTQTHFGPFAAASCSSTGVLRPCASPPPTSSARRSATCSSCAATASPIVDRLDRLLDRAPARARVDSDGAPLPGPRDACVVGPGTKTGMAIRYDNPREIGADRLVNAVAIRERFGGARSASTSARRRPSTSSPAMASTSAAR